jgi:hypothetical protein
MRDWPRAAALTACLRSFCVFIFVVVFVVVSVSGVGMWMKGKRGKARYLDIFTLMDGDALVVETGEDIP